MRVDRLKGLNGKELEGPLLITPQVFGDDRGFLVAQRVWDLNNITFLDVYTYDTKDLRLNKKTLWLVERKNEVAEFDNIVENYNYIGAIE